jgi:hypothetical protein
MEDIMQLNAKSILERHIESGLASARSLFAYVETNTPRDAIARATALEFAPSERSVVVRTRGTDYHSIHKHAGAQLAAKAGIPSAYLSDLANGQDWQRELAAHALTQHFAHDEGRYLLRAVPQGNGSMDMQLRGFLSDRYRRIDSRPLLHAFAEECEKIGAKPVGGSVSDTRMAVKAIVPQVFEPVPGEAIAFGLEWGNSDYGSAKHTVRAFILRLWCLNGATMENALSEVHLGKRMNEDIEYSRQTYDLDTRHSISALRDVVRGVLGERKIQKHVDAIQQAASANVDWKRAGALLSKRLNKGELTRARESFEGPDVINLPPGNTMWRVSNAVSWLAGSTEDTDRKLELERVAGELIDGRVDNAA